MRVRALSLACLGWILAAGAVLAAPPWQDAAAERSAASAPVPCLTCAGAGQAVLTCELCDGTGQAPCFECVSPWAARRSARARALVERIDPEKVRQLKAHEDLLRKLDETLIPLIGSSLLSPEPGVLPCPNACARGTLFPNHGLPCKVCDGKGVKPCPPCKGKGAAKCFACLGERERRVPCPECFGAGTTRDVLARTAEDAATCAWCAGAVLRSCEACAADGLADQPCLSCGATGQRTCRRCAGTKETNCTRCPGSGYLSSMFDSKAANCPACDRTGVVPCGWCDEGHKACELCSGKGAGRLPCWLCLGFRSAPCPGCDDGSSRSWRITGERLLAGGKAEAAAAHVEVALRRQEARNESELSALEAGAKETRARRKELEKELQALRALLARATKAR